jgi:Tfp pilus assembly protein PilO
MTQNHTKSDADDRPPEPIGWHLKKEVNLTIIISVICIAITMVTGYSDLKRDIALIQADQLVLHQRDVQQASESAVSMGLIRAQYERLEGKLDRIIERGLK